MHKATEDFFSEAMLVFLRFSETQSLSRTASELHLSPSAVSRQIQNLERHLELDLVERNRRPITLSQEGKLFAQSMLAQEKQIRQIICRARGQANIRPQLRIGFLESFVRVSEHFIPHILPKISQLTSLSGTTDRLRRLLLSLDLDIIVTSNPEADIPGMIRTFLLREPSLLVMPKTIALPREPQISWQNLEFCGLPYIRSFRQSASGIHTENFVEANSLRFSSIVELDNIGVKLSLIAKGKGWSIIPVMSLYQNQHLIQSETAKDLWIRPMPRPTLFREISIIASQKVNRDLYQTVVTLLAQQCRTQVLPWIQNFAPWIKEEFLLNPDI